MGDILKEAIADAKAVRETALANAKMALEEAFTPQLKSMLSAKLKEDEFDDEEEEFGDEEEEFGDEEGGEEDFGDDGGEEDFGDEGGEEDFGDEGGDEGGDEDAAAVDIDIDADGDDAFDDEEDEVEENIIELNGQSFRLVPIEEDAFEEDAFGEDTSSDSLDLDNIIRELESELEEGTDDDDDTVDEAKDDDDDTVDEAFGDKEDDEDDDDDKVDETFDIDENLFLEDDEEEEVKEASDSDDDSTKAELEEYKEAVRFLKDKLHEVNILNAKLLFTNKLFKEFALDNGQKMKVVETFDRTQSTREIKLVYSTLAEQFSDNGSIKNRNPIRESASKKSGSTKPSKESSKVITEEANVADRFKKLAGII